jgi:hypothetical protein
MKEKKRDEAKDNLVKIMLLEESSWGQESKALWLREGERNTKLFHRLENSH